MEKLQSSSIMQPGKKSVNDKILQRLVSLIVGRSSDWYDCMIVLYNDTI
jgi:hypothetical protein